MFFDSHCHLTDERFADDADATLQRAASAGIEGVVTIASNLADARAALALAESRPGVWSSAGVHPHAAASWDAEAGGAIRELASAAACVAIGEIGLDYHYDTSPRETQRRVFDTQLALAAALRLPAVVHSRSADADTAAAIRTAGAAVRGVLHCYTGSRALLDVALGAGWYISFTGMVSFRNYDDAELVRAVPADRLMIETDSPYLAPVPYRGRRNEPAYVVAVAAALAQLRSEPLEQLARASTATARAFYGIPAGERLGVSSH